MVISIAFMICYYRASQLAQMMAMFIRITNIYQEYPSKFWVVGGVSFIDRVGGTMLFPFFSLFITKKFDVGMTQVGIVLGIFSIFGLVFSALSTLSLGLV